MIRLVDSRRCSRIVDSGESDVFEMPLDCFLTAAVPDPELMGDDVEFKLVYARLTPKPLSDKLFLRGAAEVVDQKCRFLNWCIHGFLGNCAHSAV